MFLGRTKVEPGRMYYILHPHVYTGANILLISDKQKYVKLGRAESYIPYTID